MNTDALALALLEALTTFADRHAQETDSYCVVEGGEIHLYPTPGPADQPHLTMSPREARVLVSRLLDAAAEAERIAK